MERKGELCWGDTENGSACLTLHSAAEPVAAAQRPMPGEQDPACS